MMLFGLILYAFLYTYFSSDIFDNQFMTIMSNPNQSIFNGIPKFYYASDLHLQQSYFLLGNN